ncbi:acyl-CoA/acyl-ACP dehydrogenase [Microbacterium sp. zg.Y1090]|uniref:acyl-CoA dehydrogenase family protein n=1 Tax=Microbacterium TaxID=33882 RepID=UPI00214CAE76|nr:MULTISPECIES: acyl-CoA dehydrogenase family protein [unclassified Microbacterium]MCR2813328.1 acyl-CoA/acyl-ACP dehydrogenase [Microbacterium sp. zg.Y1084]MCR2819838.1 acyl-CoA/acyl-ACP dehydrogenase [Microbacterium sp. zg.Y1090]MDL5487949.1 acyl-CoA dehydrogenase family protein [Microbacterium sp. zg-Y1211]WIM28605.1 acyl-CoA dehydrogenase family protein [Microbacterium sp. zg-Y1090]
MALHLSDEQQELISLLQDVLAQRADSAATRRVLDSGHGFDEELWTLLCGEIGVASLAIPEQYGGAGYTVEETQLVLEELGYSLAPSPFLGSVSICAQAILLSGDEDAAARLLPAIADGTTIAALGWADAVGRWNPSSASVDATPGDTWRLNGDVPLVLEGETAGILVVIARTPEGPRLFEVLDAAAVPRTATPAMDLTLRVATLHLRDAAARPLGHGGSSVLDELHAVALTAVAAVQAGTARRALDMTVEYAKQRVQFGRPIGSFQAIKHRLADMHVRAETARTAARAAARALADGDGQRHELAATAKATCSDALELIASETVQLHGGIAITWEHDAHLVFKRSHALGQLFGTAQEQRARLADALLAVS